ncbi:MAG TPA: energy transducer TonB [Burkholderiales bacterium]|nr:energy transducer TonB [Burkholderiales bacterium]
MERIRRRDPVAAAAYGRLGIALMLSAAFHVFLVAQPPGIGVRSLGPVPAPLIRARLEQPPRDNEKPPLTHRIAPADAAGVRAGDVAVSSVPVSEASDAAALPAAEQSFTLPDLVYYPVSDLDVYPVPVSPISVSSADAVREAGIPPARVSLWVSIDETGWPAEVAIHDSDPEAVFDDAAMTALRGARFSPARKDGRPVRSRVLIELEFGRVLTD